MQLPQIAFIGAGNMSRALLGGLTRNGVDPARLVVADPSEEQRQLSRSQFGVRVSADNVAAVQDVDVVIVAVKPQVMRGTMSTLAGALASPLPPGFASRRSRRGSMAMDGSSEPCPIGRRCSDAASQRCLRRHLSAQLIASLRARSWAQSGRRCGWSARS